MEMRRKGFVYTMEAIIASGLFLMTVLFIVPEFQPEGERTVQETVHSSLDLLYKTGELQDNVSVEEIEEDVSGYVPAGYNYSVKLTRADTESYRFSGGDSFYLEREQGYNELRIWVKESSDLDITFRGKNVIRDLFGRKYIDFSLESDGYLNFTGSGKGSFDHDIYREEGSSPEMKDLKSVSYIMKKGNTTEVKVFLWQ